MFFSDGKCACSISKGLNWNRHIFPLDFFFEINFQFLFFWISQPYRPCSLRFSQPRPRARTLSWRPLLISASAPTRIPLLACKWRAGRTWWWWALATTTSSSTWRSSLGRAKPSTVSKFSKAILESHSGFSKYRLYNNIEEI